MQKSPEKLGVGVCVSSAYGDSDVGVDVAVMPVAVAVEARKDGLAFGESVLHVNPVMT